jgi:hypothetical protein
MPVGPGRFVAGSSTAGEAAVWPLSRCRGAHRLYGFDREGCAECHDLPPQLCVPRGI